MSEIYSIKVKCPSSKENYYYDIEGTLSHAMVRLKHIGKEIATNFLVPSDFEWRILNEEFGTEEGELMSVRGTFDKQGNPTEIRIIEVR